MLREGHRWFRRTLNAQGSRTASNRINTTRLILKFSKPCCQRSVPARDLRRKWGRDSIIVILGVNLQEQIIAIWFQVGYTEPILVL